MVSDFENFLQQKCSYHERRVYRLAHSAGCGVPHLVLQFTVKNTVCSLSTATVMGGPLHKLAIRPLAMDLHIRFRVFLPAHPCHLQYFSLQCRKLFSHRATILTRVHVLSNVAVNSQVQSTVFLFRNS